MPRADFRPTSGRVPRAVARLVAAAALAVDAYIHAKLADQYDPITSHISQGNLFRVESGLASLAALLVLVWRRPLGDAFAWTVAAGGLFALMLYRYVNVGTLGPLPNMYEPIWSYDKKVTAIAQIVALVALSLLLITRSRPRRRTDDPAPARTDGPRVI